MFPEILVQPTTFDNSKLTSRQSGARIASPLLESTCLSKTTEATSPATGNQRALPTKSLVLKIMVLLVRTTDLKASRCNSLLQTSQVLLNLLNPVLLASRRLLFGKILHSVSHTRLILHRMGELEPWIDENFVRNLWFQMGEQVSVKMIRDKFSGYDHPLPFIEHVLIA